MFLITNARDNECDFCESSKGPYARSSTHRSQIVWICRACVNNAAVTFETEAAVREAEKQLGLES